MATAEVRRPPHWALPALVLGAGMFMSVLDSSVVSVALPAMQKEFNVINQDIQWISTAYRLSLAVVIPASAWLAGRIGLRRLYVLSLALFGATSLLCGLASGVPSLVFFRVLQAVPGAIVPVVCISLLSRVTPPAKLGSAMGVYASVIILAPGISPLIGGWFTEYLDWRFIFFVNVPISALAALGALAVLPAVPGHRMRRFDMPGFTAIALGLFALSLGLAKGQQWGWDSYKVLVLLAIGVNALLLFVGIELWVEQPLLNLRVFTSQPFVVALILIDILFTSMQAVLLYVPTFLQQGERITPANTGLVLLPQAGVWIVAVAAAGWVYNRFGARWPSIVALSMVGIGILALTRVNVDLPRSTLGLWMCLVAAGIGLGIVPLMGAGVAALPVSLIADGVTFRTAVQRVTAAFGLTGLTSMANAQQAQLFADRSALLKHSGADADPRILAMQEQGPAGLVGLWQRLQAMVAAQAYSNVFLVVGLITLGGAALAFLARWGQRPHGEVTVVSTGGRLVH